MKTRMTQILVVAAAVAVVIALAPGASANCIPNKTAATFSTGGYVYIIPGGSNAPANLSYRFWQQGNPANNSGTYNDFLFADPPGSTTSLSMNAALGDSRVNGCPLGTLITLIQSRNPPGFIIMSAIEGQSGTEAQFDYAFGRVTGSSINALAIPRPTVGGSSRSGLTVSLTGVGIPAAPSPLVTGFEILRVSGADPGRDASAWNPGAPVQVVASSGGNAAPAANIVADCSNPAVDQFYATRLTFVDNQKSDLVSASTRVNCNPSLADPKFKIVPKKATPQGTKAKH